MWAMRDDRYLKDLSQKSHWTTRFSWCILLCSLHRCFTLNVLLHSTHSNEMSSWVPSLWFFSPLCDRNVFSQPGTSHTYLNPSCTVAWCCRSLLWLEFVKLKDICVCISSWDLRLIKTFYRKLVYNEPFKTINATFLNIFFTCKVEQLYLDLLPAKLALVQSVAMLLPNVPK